MIYFLRDRLAVHCLDDEGRRGLPLGRPRGGVGPVTEPRLELLRLDGSRRHELRTLGRLFDGAAQRLFGAKALALGGVGGELGVEVDNPREETAVVFSISVRRSGIENLDTASGVDRPVLIDETVLREHSLLLIFTRQLGCFVDGKRRVEDDEAVLGASVGALHGRILEPLGLQVCLEFRVAASVLFGGALGAVRIFGGENRPAVFVQHGLDVFALEVGQFRGHELHVRVAVVDDHVASVVADGPAILDGDVLEFALLCRGKFAKLVDPHSYDAVVAVRPRADKFSSLLGVLDVFETEFFGQIIVRGD